MEEQDSGLPRRRFLIQLAVVGAGASVLTFANTNRAALADAGMAVVGKTSDFVEGEYKKVTLPSGSGAYVMKTGGSFHALSSKCTHRGCEVLWVPARKIFQCPCHGAQFDAEGKNIVGPAKTPLVDLPTRVDGDTVYVAVS